MMVVFFTAKMSLFHFGNIFVNFLTCFTIFEKSYLMIITFKFFLANLENQLKVRPSAMVADDAPM